MPLVKTLQVIRTYDGMIRPPGPKMVACLCPDHGWFARINTDGWRAGSVPLSAKLHPFLRHDSHIECGAVFEMDDYVVQQALDDRGILGSIDATLVGQITAAIVKCKTLRENDRRAILDALAAL